MKKGPRWLIASEGPLLARTDRFWPYWTGASPSASQAEVEGEGPLTTPPLSGSRSPLSVIGILNLAAHAPSSCSAYSIGSLPGKYNVRYIGSLSVSHDVPHETQPNTSSVSADCCEACKTMLKASGAHTGQYLSLHADRPPSARNHAQ